MKIPFSPSVYEHAAAMIGRSPWDTSRDPELLYAGHRAAYLEYRHSPIVVGIDIYNLEAEAYGSKVRVPGENGIPAIHEALFSNVDEAIGVQPFDPAVDGRIPMVIEVGRTLKADLSGADVRIPVAGPFSIAFNLLGIEKICTELALQPGRTAKFLMRIAENQRGFCEAIVDAGLDVAFFESAAAPPLVSPMLFREIELPALKRAIQVAESIVGHPVPCIMGGNTYPILESILSTGTGYVVCNVETDQEAFVQRTRSSYPDVKVRINMDPGIVACTEPDRICKEVDRIVELAADHPNCLMGTGCLPYETPPANIRLINEYLDE
jgi:uroporphyrinogen decarboxylase